MEKSYRECGEKTSPISPLFFKKALTKVKASGQHLSF